MKSMIIDIIGMLHQDLLEIVLNYINQNKMKKYLLIILLVLWIIFHVLFLYVLTATCLCSLDDLKNNFGSYLFSFFIFLFGIFVIYIQNKIKIKKWLIATALLNFLLFVYLIYEIKSTLLLGCVCM
jgi:hypothetical protein